jgi:hypothetical protein
MNMAGGGRLPAWHSPAKCGYEICLCSAYDDQLRSRALQHPRRRVLRRDECYCAVEKDDRTIHAHASAQVVTVSDDDRISYDGMTTTCDEDISEGCPWGR